MNLYRSFGNLMEAWMSEGGQCSDSEWLGNNEEDSPTSSSDMGTNLRSESVDSGVETASSDTSFLAASCSVSTDNAEIDAFTPEREGDGLAPASASPVLPSPVLSSSSSSSPRLRPSTAQGGSTALHQRLEQALQRTDSKRVQGNPEPLTVDEVLRRRPRASLLPKRHASELVRGQRSDGFGLKRTVNPSVPTRQMSETRRRPTSMSFDKQTVETRSEALGVEDGKGLSPGLSYLEQVCQMLEEIARQKMHSQALQMEVDALREDQDMEVNQALNTCQTDFKAAEEDLSSCQRLENAKRSENTKRAERNSSEPQRRKEYPKGHFRQRSSSETSLATLHLRKLSADSRGQHLSVVELLEKVEEDHEKQEFKKKQMEKTDNSVKSKVGSLRREESAGKDTKGQQMQSSEKNSARRRLSHLFRRRRKTLPV